MATTTMQDISDKLGISNAAQRAVDKRLDDAVEDSFPASDPVQLSMPHDREELNLHRTNSSTMWLVGGGLLALLAVIALRR